jgi:hypothetical protein
MGSAHPEETRPIVAREGHIGLPPLPVFWLVGGTQRVLSGCSSRLADSVPVVDAVRRYARGRGRLQISVDFLGGRINGVAAQTIEAQPVFGQDRAIKEATCVRVDRFGAATPDTSTGRTRDRTRPMRQNVRKFFERQSRRILHQKWPRHPEGEL